MIGIFDKIKYLRHDMFWEWSYSKYGHHKAAPKDMSDAWNDGFNALMSFIEQQDVVSALTQELKIQKDLNERLRSHYVSAFKRQNDRLEKLIQEDLKRKYEAY